MKRYAIYRYRASHVFERDGSVVAHGAMWAAETYAAQEELRDGGVVMVLRDDAAWFFRITAREGRPEYFARAIDGGMARAEREAVAA